MNQRIMLKIMRSHRFMEYSNALRLRALTAWMSYTSRRGPVKWRWVRREKAGT